jgi:hypothetical protein
MKKQLSFAVASESEDKNTNAQDMFSWLRFIAGVRHFYVKAIWFPMEEIYCM